MSAHSPRTSTLTHEALNEIARMTVENIARVRTGEPFLEGTIL